MTSSGMLTPAAPLERALAATPGIVRWEGWIATEARLTGASTASSSDDAGQGHALPHSAGLHGAAPGHAGFTVVALPPESVFMTRRIEEGRDLLPGEGDALVANSALAAAVPELAVGHTVTLAMGPSELVWRVVGIAREPFSPPLAYVPRRIFDEQGGHAGMANTLRLVLERPANPASLDALAIQAVRDALDENLEHEGVRARSSSTQAESRYGFDQHMRMLYVFLLVVAGILAGVGGCGLMTTLSLNVSERRAELGLLRALGATPRTVASIVVAEGLAIGLLSSALAALIAWLLGGALGDALVQSMLHSSLDSAFELRGLWAWLCVALGLGVLASSLPAWHAARSSVREALARE